MTTPINRAPAMLARSRAASALTALTRKIAGAVVIVLVGVLFAGGTLTGCASSEQQREASEPAPAVTHPELRAQLRDLFRRDQRARKDMIAAINDAPPPGPGQSYHPDAMPAVERVIAIDREASDAMEAIIAEHGWPTFDMVGEDGANAAWLIAQHADRRPEFQARALGLMEAAVDDGQADPATLAYLTDRVLVSRKQPQRYGTQFAADADDVQRPYPIEGVGGPDSAADLDRRRAAVGLPPMRFAARQWGEALSAEASPEPFESWPE